MPRIYVEFTKLKQCGENLITVAGKIDKINSDFRTTVKNLDWDIKYKSDINKTAERLAQNIEGYAKALKTYQKLIDNAQNEYSKLDAYKFDSVKLDPVHIASGVFSNVGSLGDGFAFIENFKNIITNAKDGNIGKAVAEILNGGFNFYKVAEQCAEHIEEFKQVKADKSTKEAIANWTKSAAGLEEVTGISNSDKFLEAFKTNITDVDSPFSVKHLFNDYKWNGGIPLDDTMTDEAKKLAESARGKANATAALSWIEVGLSGITNLFDNIEEKKESDGTMSNARVAAETVIETGSGIALRKIGTALIGGAITAGLTAIGAPIAAPALLAITLASNIAVTGADAIIEKTTQKKATEWISDFILDGVENIAAKIGEGVKNVFNPKPTWSDEMVIAY